MFSGLIEGLGKVKEVHRTGGDMQLTITPLLDAWECTIGDSISVSGVCLTVVSRTRETFTVDVSGETLTRTTMGLLKSGDEVNLERALRVEDRLGGHLVTGHVDAVGRIVKKEQAQRSWRLGIGVDEAISKYMIEKGSVAVDGISLTINRCDEKSFEVNIIPQTAKETTLLRKKTGDPVNIETDMIGKYVEKFFTRGKSSQKEKKSQGIDIEMLREHGFGD